MSLSSSKGMTFELFVIGGLGLVVAAAVLLLLSGVATTAFEQTSSQLSFGPEVLQKKTFTLSGAAAATVTPFTARQNVSEFYGYSGELNAPAIEAAVQAEADTSVLALYTDSASGTTSLVFHNDLHGDGSGGRVSMAVAGTDYRIAVEDDLGEFGNWNWGGCCSDGAAIELPSLAPGTRISIRLLSSQGIEKWVFASPDSVVGLDMNETLLVEVS